MLSPPKRKKKKNQGFLSAMMQLNEQLRGKKPRTSSHIIWLHNISAWPISVWPRMAFAVLIFIFISCGWICFWNTIHGLHTRSKEEKQKHSRQSEALHVWRFNISKYVSLWPYENAPTQCRHYWKKESQFLKLQLHLHRMSWLPVYI